MDPSVHSYAIWKDPITSSSMDVLKSKAMMKALKWILFKYGKI
jgi:hypothetical protein